jgi:hypothetical protein
MAMIKPPTKTVATMIMMIIGVLTTMAVGVIPLTAVVAQAVAVVPITTTMIGSSTANTTTTTSSSGIQISEQPILQERTRAVSETPINYAHLSITYSGNGTLTMPDNITTTMANFTTNGSALISFVTQSAQGTETITTGNGETATVTFYEIVKFNAAASEGKGIIIAEVRTDPTGTLASLNGMTLVGVDEILPNGESSVTLWEWESGISDLDIVPAHDELTIR